MSTSRLRRFWLILNLLDNDQKQERIILAEATITIFEENTTNGFQHILTVNKSCFSGILSFILLDLK
jgi:hypothetical protein